MIAVIIGPYEAISAPAGAGIAPQAFSETSGGNEDITGNSLQSGIPVTNLLVTSANVTGAQLAAIKSDNRFFVLSPGPGNNGNALTTWLSGKGVNGHGVTNSDTAEEATTKLREHFRTAP